MAFFIKRGEKVHGPFSAAQIKSGVKNGEVKSADVISNSKEGPWQPLADAISKPQPPVESQETDLPELEPLEMAPPPLEEHTLDADVSSAPWSRSPATPTATIPSSGKNRLVIIGLVGTVAILFAAVVLLLSRTQSGPAVFQASSQSSMAPETPPQGRVVERGGKGGELSYEETLRMRDEQRRQMRQMNRPGVAPARTPQPQARTPQPQARPPQPRQNAHELAKRHVEKLSSNAKASGDVETFLECQGILGAIAALKLGNPSLLRSFGSGTVAKAQGFIDMYKN